MDSLSILQQCRHDSADQFGLQFPIRPVAVNATLEIEKPACYQQSEVRSLKNCGGDSREDRIEVWASH